MSTPKKSTKGGARAGSGRPRIEGRHTKNVTATDAEWDAMLQTREIVRGLNLQPEDRVTMQLMVSKVVKPVEGIIVSTHVTKEQPVDGPPFRFAARPYLKAAQDAGVSMWHHDCMCHVETVDGEHGTANLPPEETV